jgi:hypothetical protein
VGVLDQISILRNPATADLKQDQYSTEMVQSSRIRITDVYYSGFNCLRADYSSISFLSF